MTNDQQSNLEDIIRYLKLEVPHYFEQNFRDVKYIDEFSYKVEFEDKPGVKEEVAHTFVYEVTLESGEKVFAVKGGFFDNLMNNVYGEKFPNPDIASKY